MALNRCWACGAPEGQPHRDICISVREALDAADVRNNKVRVANGRLGAEKRWGNETERLHRRVERWTQENTPTDRCVVPLCSNPARQDNPHHLCANHVVEFERWRRSQHPFM